MLQTYRKSIFLFLLQVIFFHAAFADASQSLAIIGDAGQAGLPMERLRHSIAQAQVKSIIMPGDNLYSGTYEGTWDLWKLNGFQFDVVALGNHHEGYENEIKYFSMPGEYYSKAHQGARFLVLNSDNQNNVEAQFSWLESEIKHVTEKLVFLVYHHPTYTVTDKHSWGERKQFQLKMREFLKIYGHRISAIFLGHDHISSFIDFGTVPAVVAGAGRDVRSAKPVNYREEGTVVRTRYLAPKTQHWAELEISENADEARVHFVRVADQRRVCTAHIRRNTFQLAETCN